MLVTKKKRSVQTRRGHGTKPPNQQLDSNSKVTKGKEGIFNNNLTPFNPELTFQFKAGQASGAIETVNTTSKSCEFVEIYTHEGRVETTKKNSKR